MSGRVLGDLAMFLLLVALSRAFGAQGVGKYAFALAVTNLLAIAADFGLYEQSIKELSRVTGSLSEAMGRYFAARLLLVLVVFGAFFVALPVLPLPSDTRMILGLLAGFALFNTMQRGVNGVFVAREHTRIAAALEFSLRGAASVGAISVIAAGGELTAAVAVFPLAGAGLLAGALIVLIRRCGAITLNLRWTSLRQTLRAALPYALSSLFGDLNTRLTVIVLIIFAGEAAAGVYSVAYRVVFFLLMVPYFARLSLLPLASRFFAESLDQFQSLFHYSVRIGLIVAAPAMVGLFLVAPQVITLLYGPGFEASVPVFRILAVLVLLGSAARIFGAFLMASDRQGPMTRRQGIACALNIFLCVVLIPPFGVVGAAVATIASEGVSAALSGWLLKDIAGWPRLQGRLLISAVGVATFGIPFALLKPMPLALVVPSCVALYAVILLVFPETRNNELRTLLALLRASRRSESKEVLKGPPTNGPRDSGLAAEFQASRVECE